MSNGRDDTIFKALSSPLRRELLDAMRNGPSTTGALCARFPSLDRCTVMQHLKVLEEADLLVVRRSGRERWNHLNPLPIKDIFERWIGGYAAHAAQAVQVPPVRRTPSSTIPEF